MSFLEELRKGYAVCRKELDKTQKIARKLIDGSETKNEIAESYIQLGEIFENALKDDQIQFESEEVKEIISKIEKNKKSLASLDGEVSDLKFSETKNS